ncbi:MAG: hypothetical protein ACKD6O_07935 [Candidatus Bathyarchaeota archaeon]
MEIDIGNLVQWLIGGLGVSSLAVILVLILVFLGILKIAKGLVVQSLLLIVSWVPSAVLSSVVNVQSTVPVKGFGLILFPYVWDTLLGACAGTEIAYISAVMLAVSFIAFLHLSIMFCAKWKIKYYYAPLIAYICLVALGLGLFNTHKALYSAYENYCVSSGVHPAMPLIFMVFVLLIIFILYWGRKRRSVV